MTIAIMGFVAGVGEADTYGTEFPLGRGRQQQRLTLGVRIVERAGQHRVPVPDICVKTQIRLFIGKLPVLETTGLHPVKAARSPAGCGRYGHG